MPIQSQLKKDWMYVKYHSREGLIGLWAKFLEFIGLTAEAAFNWEYSKGDVYQFEELRTEFIDPTSEYIKDSIFDPPVAKHILNAPYPVIVYMITGVKIATGATVAFARSRELSGNIRGGAGAAKPGSGGLNAAANWIDGKELYFRSPSAFVFAYRLREIHYNEKDRRIQQRAFDGSLFDLDTSNSPNETREYLESAIEVVGMANESQTVENLDLKTEEALDDADDHKCAFVVTRNH
ncbi:hypothetical protein BDV27DRAFT_132590 [Aspergillus caelatus]|uniref:Uncharacterized protein n=2 Tax=Aspergillus subgen. Circumdati TaxID=2720871 RepID=A0A5N6ZWH6_9EURO|nr:uncharacterized protein BDV27DRAFT_132590 [Aspergillus caelatus]KAE8361735.1 hypothetical protein BDV27DRAFT_132590 [Aspergillus caelatus]